MSLTDVTVFSRLAVVTDEVDRDIRTAVRRCREWGIWQVDVRAVGDCRVPHLDDAARVALAEAAEAVRIRRLSPGVFKGPMQGAEVRRELDVVLPATLDLARQVEARQVVVFGGGRGETRANAIAALRDARDAADAAGVELVVENSALCRVASVGDLLEVVDAVGIRVVWDPGNAVAAGAVDPVGDSARIAGSTACVHLRDRDGSGWRRLDQGFIRWRDAIAGLEESGFRGVYVVESHMPSDPGATEWNVRTLAQHLAEALGEVSATDARSIPGG